MSTWRTVPVIPDRRMVIAFAAEIRHQAGLLPPGAFAHEPLEPLWAAVLAVAPEGPARAAVPSSAVESYNAGVRDVLAIALTAAAAIEAKTKRPLAEGFGIEALQALATEAEALVIQAKPKDGPEAVPTSVTGTPRGPAPATAALILPATKEVT